MADAQVQVVISAKDDASKVFSKVGSSAADLAKTLAVGIVGAGAAVAAGLGVAVKSAADFEAQMSGIRAVSGATQDEMTQLSAKALQLGKDTSFSASEAAAGIEELVKGGVSIPDVMNGAAEATLNLAAAGGVDLVTAAEVASNAMNTFGMSGSEMAHVADEIAGAANASSLSVTDFKFAMASTGSVVKAAGGDFDSTTTAITAMANAGIKGSDAGTSLKAMLTQMLNPTKEQTTLMKQLGLATADGSSNFFDATGKLKTFNEIGGLLQTSLKGMTDEQKASTLATLFLNDGMRAGIVLEAQGKDGMDNLATSISKVSAETVAAERLNNLTGDIKQLGGSAETAGIKLGEAFQQPLRDATQALTKFINEQVIPFIDEHGPAFAEAVSAAGKSLVEGAGNLVDSTKRAAQDGLQALRDKLAETGRDLDQWTKDHGKVGEAVSESLVGVSGAALALQFILQGNFKAGVEEGWKALDHFKKSADDAKLAVKEFQDQAAKTQPAATALDSLKKSGDDLHKTFDNLGKIAPTLADWLGRIAGGALGAAGGVGTANDKFDLMAFVVRAVLAPITNFTKALADGTTGIGLLLDAMGQLGPFFDNTRAQVQAFADATPDALKGAVAAWDQFRDDVAAAVGAVADNVGTALSTAAASALAQAAAIGSNIIQGIKNGITEGIPSLAGAAASAAQSALNSAKAQLGISSPSTEFRLVGMESDEGFAEGLLDGQSLIEDAASEVATDALDAIAPEAEAAGYDLGQSVTDGIAAGLGKVKVIEGAMDSLKGTVAGAMRDLAADVTKITSETTTKLGDIGRKAGDAINQAIIEASRAIKSTFDDATQRISELTDNLSASRALRGLREAFAAGLEGAGSERSSKRSAEDLARDRSRSSEDLARDRAREDAKNQTQLKEDLEAAKTGVERAAIQQRFDDSQKDLIARRKDEDEDRAYRQKREDEDRAYRQKREDEDRDYRKEQDLARQQFEDNLENDALQKSITRTIADRDARIKSINDALEDKKKKIEADAENEKKLLRDSSVQKIQILKDEFLAKLPALTAQASEVMNTFLSGIDAAMQGIVDTANEAIRAIADIPRRVDVEVVRHESTVVSRERTPSAASDSNLENSPRGPLMDTGGVVRGPAWVEVGRGVNEAFIPLNGSSASGGPTVVNISVYGTVVTPRELVDAVHEGLLAKKRGAGALGLA